MLLVEQLVHRRFVHPGPLVLRTVPLKYPTPVSYTHLDGLPASVFQGIPGIDMDLRLERYYRVNYIPTFIAERTPSESREDLWELLTSVGLDYYDRFEWLLRTTPVSYTHLVTGMCLSAHRSGLPTAFISQLPLKRLPIYFFACSPVNGSTYSISDS